MDQDSDSRDSGDDYRSSTVISVAQSPVCFAALVDELVVRIYSLAQLPDCFAATTRVDETALQDMWPAIISEGDHWWAEHALEKISPAPSRRLITELLSRGPLDGALLSISAFTGKRLILFGPSDLEVIQSWGAVLFTSHRVVAQGLAWLILAPWFAANPVDQFGVSLTGRARQGVPSDVDFTLLICLGLIQIAPEQSAPLIFEVLASIALRSDLQAIELLGGVIGRLWPLLPERVENWLSENCGRLARRVFRLAVERLPAGRRTELTAQWKTLRLERPR